MFTHRPDFRTGSRTRTSRLRGRGSAPSRSVHLRIEPLESRWLLTAVMVTDTSNAGLGSLSQAIYDVNNISGLTPDTDTIDFDIPGDGPFLIQPTEPLPVIINPVHIEGNTQPGSSPRHPMVVLDGTYAGGNAGLEFDISSSDTSNVNGLVIDNFANDGILVNPSNQSSLQITDNFIGVDVNGSFAQGNGQDGVYDDGSNVQVDDNVISGNGHDGVEITGAGASRANGSLVEGNYIGTDATGTFGIGNGNNGVEIENGANEVVVKNNVASANGWADDGGPDQADGIDVHDINTYGALIKGNYVGTDVSGEVPLGNDQNGISISGPDATIGGTIAGSGNVISSNGRDGIWLTYSSIYLIEGNRIGTDATGTVALGNTGAGVDLYYTNNNTIGGTSAAARNLISGNDADGVIIQGGSFDNLVEGNLIGTDIGGTLALGNSSNGVNIYDSTGTTVGGTSPTARNIISGNAGGGIADSGDSMGSVIVGNWIGTDLTGSQSVGNGGSGVGFYYTSCNTIGGTTAGAGNVISGNNSDGVTFYGLVSRSVIEGNLIGTDISGAIPLGNDQDGVDIGDSCDNTIGGSTAAARNIISANAYEGIIIAGDDSINDLVQNNYIGTDITGTVAIPNNTDTTFEHAGVVIRADASGNSVRSNLISGNLGVGISVDNGSFNNTVSGNIIGTTISGEEALGNGGGVIIQSDAHNNLIAQNLISGNSNVGVNVVGTPGVTNNLIVGNLIGTDATGMNALGNQGDGVDLFEPDNTLGGTTAQDRNVISGNSGSGVGLYTYLGNCPSIPTCVLADEPCVQAESVRTQCGFPTFPPP